MAKLDHTWSIEPGGHFKLISHAQQVQMHYDAFGMISEVCGLRFQRKTKGHANIRFSFHNDLEMDTACKVCNREPPGPGGLMWKNGQCWLNNERPFGLTRTSLIIIVHEVVAHYLFDVSEETHLGDRLDSIFHSYVHTKYFAPYDVGWLQRTYELPSRVFYPWDKKETGDHVRTWLAKYNHAQSEHQRLVPIRNETTGVALRAELTEEIKKNLKARTEAAKMLGEHSRKWHDLKRRWQNTLMAG